MINYVLNWWYKRLRGVDLKILWPECVANARDLDHAKAAFAAHTFNDPVWLVLGEQGIKEFIDKLEP